MGHLAGLDGLRGLSVIAVLLYHAGVLPGGYLGVEVFFVLSGYLITRLLLAEWSARRTVNVIEFWRRRARRLLPGSTAMIVVTLTLVTVLLPGELAVTRTSAIAGLLSVSNWYAVLSQQSYFEAIGRPPLLRHLWSLAVEAQFYVAWPLLLVVGLRFTSRRKVAVLAFAGALASAALMCVLFEPGVDPSRVYYGTDTRASGLLTGAALALAGFVIRAKRGMPRFAIDAIGLFALCALGLISYALNEFDPKLYRGGFLLVDVMSALIVAIAIREQSWLGDALLSWAPLRWIGERSYAIYLWHWPVFMLTRPQLDVPLEGAPLLASQVLLIGLLAAASYRFIENPFRRGGVAVKPVLKWATVGGSALTAVVVLGASAVAAPAAARPAYLPVDQIDTWAQPVVADTPVAPGTAIDVAPTASPAPTDSAEPTASAEPSIGQTVAASVDPAPVAHPRVTAIGDSVMLGAAAALSQAIDGIQIDAAISRQAATFIQILRGRAANGELGDVMVVQVGNNGPLTTDQFDTMMDILAPVGRIVVVTVKVPRPWESPNNAILRDGAQRNPAVVLADWQAESDGVPSLFWDDGIHLRPEGAAAYAALIASRALRY